jgi:hypothetical protein
MCWLAAVQREEPLGAGGRTHGMRHQGDVRFGHQRWPERQLYDVVLTSACGWAVSLIRRLLFCRAKWRFRPNAVMRVGCRVALYRSLAQRPN